MANAYANSGQRKSAQRLTISICNQVSKMISFLSFFIIFISFMFRQKAFDDDEAYIVHLRR